MMETLTLPTYPFRLKTEQSKQKIFDPVRKKYLVLTPEEWVRQHLVQFLIHEKGCPASLIEIEKGLALNGLAKRADVVVNDRNGNPLVLVECKASTVKIDQKTFDQIARYNLVVKVPYLIVSNGLVHYACAIDFENRSYRFLEEIPHYSTL
jgi:predicted type IV restriction endonuclease